MDAVANDLVTVLRQPAGLGRRHPPDRRAPSGGCPKRGGFPVRTPGELIRMPLAAGGDCRRRTGRGFRRAEAPRHFATVRMAAAPPSWGGREKAAGKGPVAHGRFPYPPGERASGGGEPRSADDLRPERKAAPGTEGLSGRRRPARTVAGPAAASAARAQAPGRIRDTVARRRASRGMRGLPESKDPRRSGRRGSGRSGAPPGPRYSSGSSVSGSVTPNAPTILPDMPCSA